TLLRALLECRDLAFRHGGRTTLPHELIDGWHESFFRNCLCARFAHLVSPLNCPEFAEVSRERFARLRHRPQGSSLISRLQQNQSGPNDRLTRVVEATFLAPR